MDAETQARLRAIAEREQAEGFQHGPGTTAPAEKAIADLKADAPAKRQSTYNVYRVDGDGAALHLVGQGVQAANDTKAILEIVNPHEVPGGIGHYTAIAQRGINVRKVGVVTEPRVVVE